MQSIVKKQNSKYQFGYYNNYQTARSVNTGHASALQTLISTRRVVRGLYLEYAGVPGLYLDTSHTLALRKFEHTA